MMWNRRHQAPPPSCDRKVLLTKHNLGVLSHARQWLTGASQILTDYTGTLRTEQYVLTRYIYKLANQFRSEKSMKILRQIISCLTRLTEADLPSLLFSLHSFVDVCQPENSEVYLPSRQMLEYKLVRLMSVAALLTQTTAYSQYAYIAVRQHVDQGVMLPQNIVMLALSARIWYVTKSLVSRVVDWYQGLMPCLDILQPTLAPWLPETDSLPTDLTAWLEKQFDLKQDTGTERSMRKTTQEEVQLDGDSGSVVKLAALEDLGEIMVRRDPVVDSEDEMVELTHETEEAEKDINHNRRTAEDSGLFGQNTRTGEKRKRLDRADIENSLKNKNKKVKRKDKQDEFSDVKQSAKKVKHKEGFSKDSDETAFEGDPAQRMKVSLKQILKSFNDVDKFETDVKTKQIQVGNRSVVISKLGKKNILRVIKTVREMVTSAKTNKLQEKRCLKKLLPALSRMLVEYEKRGHGTTASAVEEDEIIDNGETGEDEVHTAQNTVSGTGEDEVHTAQNTVSGTGASECLEQSEVDQHDAIMLRKKKKEKKQKKRLKNKLTSGTVENVLIKQDRVQKNKKANTSKCNRGRYFKT